MGNNLGKETQYTDKYDKSLLYPINREVRREGYQTMFGVDVWTAFEVSFLLSNGLPTSLVLRIFNPASSSNIFESKSLKLYLNSYNNTVFNSVTQAVERIEADLSGLALSQVKVMIVKEFKSEDFLYSGAVCLEDLVGDSTKFTKYTHSPEVLRLESSIGGVDEIVYSNLLRSNCEITNQPDWARIFIRYQGTTKVTSESLLQYIVSFRNHQEFHEPTCERIYQELMKILVPDKLLVICQYTRRGGIDINPVRANFPVSNTFILPKLNQQ